MGFTPTKVKVTSIDSYYEENKNNMSSEEDNLLITEECEFINDNIPINDHSNNTIEQFNNDDEDDDKNIYNISDPIIKQTEFKLPKELESLIEQVGEHLKYSKEKLEQEKKEVAKSPYTLGQYYKGLYNELILKNKNTINELNIMMNKLDELKEKYPEHFIFVIEKNSKLSFGKVLKTEHPELELYDKHHIKVVNYRDTPFEKPSQLFKD